MGGLECMGCSMKIFFDVDGVLIDGWHVDPDRRKPWDITLERDTGVSREALRRALFMPGEGDAESLISVCARGADDLVDVLTGILPGLGYTGTAYSFMDYWFSRDSNINPDVLSFVERLKRSGMCELYLATNQEHHRASFLWDRLGFKELFQDIFYSARLGILKDRTEFYATINRQLNIGTAERPLFFDDRENVVMTARAAGWDAEIFETSETLSKNERLREILDT